jgi:cold shock CspA family protein/ribosome-associated translation inhibitor RaiA
MELQVESRNLEVRNSWQERIDEEEKRLNRHHPGLIHNLRITFEGTSHHKEGGYKVQLVASVPNDTVVVKRKGDIVSALLVDAFDTLGQQLKELQRKRRQSGKLHEGGAGAQSPGMGLIKSVFPYESYGFIITADGQEIYFHENSLKDLNMDSLSEGDEVRFGEAEGDKGPHATWVRAAK